MAVDVQCAVCRMRFVLTGPHAVGEVTVPVHYAPASWSPISTKKGHQEVPFAAAIDPCTGSANLAAGVPQEGEKP